MWRRSPRALGALAVGVIVTSLMIGESWRPVLAQTTQVSATVETDPVPGGGDADDAAIWVHPSDPDRSTIIGTDKESGLGVYDLSGTQIQFVTGIQPNNVDIRHDFPLGGQADRSGCFIRPRERFDCLPSCRSEDPPARLTRGTARHRDRHLRDLPLSQPGGRQQLRIRHLGGGRAGWTVRAD